jgi:hypothetical protein
VFKTIADPYAGRLNLFRVVSGKLGGDGTFYNSNKDTKERFNQLLTIMGKEQKPAKEAVPGSILAVAKLQFWNVKNNTTGNITTMATMLGRAQLEDLKGVADVTTLTSGEDPNNPIDGEGNPGGIFNRTTTITVPSAPFDDYFRQVQIRVQWRTGHGGNRDIVLNSITHGNGI